MMTKKKVFIVSHSHWDREWYLPYEQHHMRLVQLMDDLLDLFKNDPDFNSFHLDGQTIILDDYLQVRPEREAEVKAAVAAGKLKIGPFYILQDDFLISAESNTRDMVIGMQDSKKWGEPVKLGYFPDTFGNMGQTPQMMKLANLDFAAFGRGVKPTGLNNQVFENEKYSSQYSEMWWQGPDQSKILSILFANWYSNGNEIPTEKEAAIKYWQQKLADVEKFASTDNLLMMNGVDHQPVQKDVTKAIKLANELFPEYEFIHSNFEDYLNAVAQAVPEDLGQVNGELTSQETDGWYTLANTASSRVYLKQENTKVQRQLENIAEPLAVMSEMPDYPQDQLRYAWKTLLQNHPHDSICGCSIDEVHQEMVTRFAKANEVGKYVANEALQQLAAKINTTTFSKEAKPFVIVNTQGSVKTDVAIVEVKWDQGLFADGYPNAQYEKMQALAKDLPDFEVVNAKGETVAFEILSQEVRFDYDLPKTKFRVPYMGLFIKLAIPVSQMAPFAWQTYALQATETKPAPVKQVVFDESQNLFENQWLQVVINKDGSLDILDKKTNRQFNNQLVFEDTGDIGNEYIYRQSADQKTILSTDDATKTKIEVILNNDFMAKVAIKQTMMVPQSADERLAYEQQSVIDITQRQAKRSQVLVPMVLTTCITMLATDDQLRFETNLNNQIKDHRLRVLFDTSLMAQTHEAESIFEAVVRPNTVSDSWKNPTNAQHQHAFVNLHDQIGGMTVGNFGLNEYEILAPNNTIAVTMLRCVGEMGDWGYFGTPEAQCIGEFTFNYSLSFHDHTEASKVATYQQARANQVAFVTGQTTIHQGPKAPDDQFLQLQAPNFAVTALKASEDQTGHILRGYNLSPKASEVAFTSLEESITKVVNFLEEDYPVADVTSLEGYEIRSYYFK